MNDRTRVLPPFAILVAISAIGPLSLNIFIPSMPGLQDEFGIPYGMAQLTLTLYPDRHGGLPADLRPDLGPGGPPSHAAGRYGGLRTGKRAWQPWRRRSRC